MKKQIAVKNTGEFSQYITTPLVADDVLAYEIVLLLGQTVSNGAFTVTAKRADKVSVTDSVLFSGESAAILLKNNMYAVPGELVLRLTISENGSVLTTKELTFTVEAPNGEADLSADDRVPALTSLILQAGANGAYALTQGGYAKEQGDYAKEQGDYAKEQIEGFEEHILDSKRHAPDFTKTELDKLLGVSLGTKAEYVEPYSVTVSSTGMLTGEDRFVLINPTAIADYAVTDALKGFVFSCTLTRLGVSTEYAQSIESSSYRNAYEILITCPSSGLILSAGNYDVSNASIDVNTYVPVLDWKEVSGGGGKKSSTIVIGNSANHTAGEVDYLCDGLADEVEINAAIQALPNGGKIILREGIYTLSSGIYISTNHITLEGMGDSTVLFADAGFSGSFLVYAEDATQGTVIKNIAFNGNNITGVYLLWDYAMNTAIDSCSFRNGVTYNIRCNGFGGIIKNCTFEGYAISLEGSYYRIINNKSQGSLVSMNSSMLYFTHVVIAGNYVNASGYLEGVVVYGTQICVVNNHIIGINAVGVGMDCVDCVVMGNTGGGAYLDYGGSNTKMINNY